MPGTKYTNQLKSNCELCFQVYNPRLGKLVINNDMYLKAHVNCLQFVETELKRIQFHDLVAQADKINCDVCSQKRATVKCRFGSCSRSFHLSCIVPSGGEIDYVASKVSCYSHTRNGEKDSLGILFAWSIYILIYRQIGFKFGSNHPRSGGMVNRKASNTYLF